MKQLGVIGSAAFAGVMVTMWFALGPFALTEPTVFEGWFADYFKFLLVPVFVTSVPAFIGSIAMIRRTAQGSPARRLWKLSLAGLIFTYGITTVAFLPLNFQLWSRNLSESGLETTIAWWLGLHVLRIAGTLFAAIYAYRAAFACETDGERPVDRSMASAKRVSG